MESSIKLLSWNPIGIWKIKNTTTTICEICKESLTLFCIICIEKTNLSKIKCQTVTGKCNHTFHKHCIEHWTEINKCCPKDFTPWTV